MERGSICNTSIYYTKVRGKYELFVELTKKSIVREGELNVNCVKIDKYFIDKLLTLREEEAITGDIISMAHKLGHNVIAEGVEENKQREYLQNFGCDKIQGYLISKPLDEEAALEFLQRSTK